MDGRFDELPRVAGGGMDTAGAGVSKGLLLFQIELLFAAAGTLDAAAAPAAAPVEGVDVAGTALGPSTMSTRFFRLILLIIEPNRLPPELTAGAAEALLVALPVLPSRR